MTPHDELKKLAEAYGTGEDAEAISWNNIRFEKAATPTAILSLLAELQALRGLLGEAVDCVHGLMQDFEGCTDNALDSSRLHEWDGILSDRFEWMDRAASIKQEQ